MIKQGFIINTAKFCIEKTGYYDDTRIDGIFYKFDGDLIPSVYIFPIESQTKVAELLLQVQAAKQKYNSFVTDVVYKQFPKLR